MDRRIEVPMNIVTFLEFSGLVFDASFVFEDELEVGRRTSQSFLDKYDIYPYESICGLLQNDTRPNILFK